jgi:hypothetical protein
MTSKKYENLKWFATFMFVLAGVLISLNVEQSKWAFPLFALGHMIVLFVFLKLKDKPMIFQNSFFLSIDLLGIYQWLLAPIF